MQFTCTAGNYQLCCIHFLLALLAVTYFDCSVCIQLDILGVKPWPTLTPTYSKCWNLLSHCNTRMAKFRVTRHQSQYFHLFIYFFDFAADKNPKLLKLLQLFNTPKQWNPNSDVSDCSTNLSGESDMSGGRTQLILFLASALPVRLRSGSCNVCISTLLWWGVTVLSYALAPALSLHLALRQADFTVALTVHTEG